MAKKTKPTELPPTPAIIRDMSQQYRQERVWEMVVEKSLPMLILKDRDETPMDVLAFRACVLADNVVGNMRDNEDWRKLDGK